MTFKENCPDIRNTKVPDIINELNLYGAKTYVYDPYVSSSDARDIYQIELETLDTIPEVDAIILAVNHSQFHLTPLKDWLTFIRGKKILLDIKSAVKNQVMQDASLAKSLYYWTL